VPLSLKEKREKLAEIKKVGAAEPVKTASPEEQKFLSHVLIPVATQRVAGRLRGRVDTSQPAAIEMTVTSMEDSTKTTSRSHVWSGPEA
jgi:hypothetical protein